MRRKTGHVNAGLRRRVGADDSRRSTRRGAPAPFKTPDQCFETDELHAQAGVLFDEGFHNVGGDHRQPDDRLAAPRPPRAFPARNAWF